MTVLVTGAAGYIGGMLIDELLRSDSASCVVGVDLKPRPKRLEAETKVRWIVADISDDTWIDELGERGGDRDRHPLRIPDPGALRARSTVAAALEP